ncbi:MAG: type II toxin-antitoxin system RelE/ParE family toxin [Bacteroidales bacterium]|jgi:plasmid stabilization system protein ParE|nr:type II toxin-antitoxin system RelE/ParE family toxin [Bacteroidales bacterium]
MVKIVWTDQAIQDLNDIGEYIANDSEQYAREIVQSLFESIFLLKTNPKPEELFLNTNLPTSEN